MRWLFLLLVVLNIFYFVWHQQEAPLRAKEVVSLSLYKGSKQEIKLLSETRPDLPIVHAKRDDGRENAVCFYLSGLGNAEVLSKTRQSLADAGLGGELEKVGHSDSGEFAFVVSPLDTAQAAESVLQNLLNEFNELKYEKKQCQGLQLSDSLHRMAPAPQ
ncbi:hypothetical protein [Pseudomonas sp. CCC3.1]|uniref:hypothetical protein n=1 Tax=Pseudomonas sp. CCC3.1 TaxID=3048607 RepID=UPI002AC9C0FA|nr:hypothetical protein [Pseudomonas sp. CCC3.1]MEB0206295.1 hypothetical protein [Pseudomonas sp. CCC3.1]WPX36639.1 hypothetical protein RHM56_00040 [Pseudomonas sp. CCC3.1]